MMTAAAAALAGCAAPCLPFSTPAHSVECDGGVLVATFNAQNNSVLAPSCTVGIDGGVGVAMVSGVVCPGEQFERLSTLVTVSCALPSLETDSVPVQNSELVLISDGGVTVCR
ncbi:MAG: hypothetical protein ACO1OB_00430 [Archangium sp.]